MSRFESTLSIIIISRFGSSKPMTSVTVMLRTISEVTLSALCACRLVASVPVLHHRAKEAAGFRGIAERGSLQATSVCRALRPTLPPNGHAATMLQAFLAIGILASRRELEEAILLLVLRRRRCNDASQGTQRHHTCLRANHGNPQRSINPKGDEKRQQK